MNNREFCHALVQTLASDQLFIKLLALHQQVMEQKVSYAAMKNFKEGTMPFFKNLHSIVERQFPHTEQDKRELLIQQINLLLPTIYNYEHIPAEQKEVMLSLKIFGDRSLLNTVDFLPICCCN